MTYILQIRCDREDLTQKKGIMTSVMCATFDNFCFKTQIQIAGHRRQERFFFFFFNVQLTYENLNIFHLCSAYSIQKFNVGLILNILKLPNTVEVSIRYFNCYGNGNFVWLYILSCKNYLTDYKSRYIQYFLTWSIIIKNKKT